MRTMHEIAGMLGELSNTNRHLYIELVSLTPLQKREIERN